jgi:hypothetical protein
MPVSLQGVAKSQLKAAHAAQALSLASVYANEKPIDPKPELALDSELYENTVWLCEINSAQYS